MWAKDVFVADELAVVAAVFRAHYLPKPVSARLQVFCTPGWSVVAAGWAVYKSLAWFEWALPLFPVGEFAVALYTSEFVLPDNVHGWVQYSLMVCVQAGSVPVEESVAAGLVRYVAVALLAAGGPAQFFVVAPPVAGGPVLFFAVVQLQAVLLQILLALLEKMVFLRAVWRQQE